jgi:membrane protease YdiL (CAAX protease family)
MNEFFSVIGQVVVIAFAGALGAIWSWRNFRLLWFVGALDLYVLYDFLLTRGFFAVPNFPADSAWNWAGKFVALVGLLCVARSPLLGYRRSGLTFPQNAGLRPALVVLLMLSVVCVCLPVWASDGRDHWETVAFQWIMPGLDEEVFYRGVLLLAMNEAFRARILVWGAAIGYGGLLTSVLFGLAHALSYQSGVYEFNSAMFLVTALPSLLLLWMRERTGSVLMPIIAHNVANGVFTLF